LPGISVPAGFSREGLPLGLQIIGRSFDEETVLRCGQIIEDAAGPSPRPEAWWHGKAASAPASKTKPPKSAKPSKKTS
jgi:aspartyl-tRNA(Asn)/glutamyl-tRNA(Gln) amidotransferase subunit A